MNIHEQMMEQSGLPALNEVLGHKHEGENLQGKARDEYSDKWHSFEWFESHEDTENDDYSRGIVDQYRTVRGKRLIITSTAELQQIAVGWQIQIQEIEQDKPVYRDYWIVKQVIARTDSRIEVRVEQSRNEGTGFARS